MAKEEDVTIFTVEATSVNPRTSSSFTVEIPAMAGRQYVTLAQGAVSLVFTKLGELLIEAENADDLEVFTKGADALISRVDGK
jgi:hypothetical protein